MEGSLLVTLSLKKLPLVVSRLSALTGLLVSYGDALDHTGDIDML